MLLVAKTLSEHCYHFGIYREVLLLFYHQIRLATCDCYSTHCSTLNICCKSTEQADSLHCSL